MSQVDLRRLAAGPAENGWLRAISAMHSAGALTFGGAVTLVGLAVIGGFSEAFGLALIFPLLSYIEAGGDTAKLALSSTLWRVIVDAHEKVGLTVSFASLAGGIWVLVLLRQSTAFVSGFLSGRVKERFTFELRAALFQAMIGARATFLNDRASGAVASLFGQMAQQAGNIVSMWTTALALAATMTIYLVGLVLVAPLATVAAFILIGALLWLFGRFLRAAKALSRDVAHETENYAASVTTRLRNWRLVKLHVAEQREAEALNTRAARIADLYMRHVLQAGKLHLLFAPMVLAGVLIGIYVATSLLNLSLATIVVFVVVIVRLTPNIEAFTRLRQTFALSGAALDRVLQAIRDAVEVQEVDTGNRPFAPPRRAVEFSNVTFRYSAESAPALDHVTVKLPAATMIAIVGPSGAGKTTFANALTRLVEPQSGQILIDDVPLTEFSLASLRRGIAAVDQSAQVLSGTIEQNLLYAKPGADKNEIEAALEMAGALDFVRQMPQKEETPVGEDGVLLSGGQRQRIALARAFLSGASIIILDEPTSALDFEAEAAFRAGLQVIKERGNVTLLVIAHRPATISDADFVVVLRNGKVEEAAKSGTLRRDAGYYRQMVEVAAGTDL